MIPGLGRTIFDFSVLGHVHVPSGLTGWLVGFFFPLQGCMKGFFKLILPYLFRKCNSIIFYGRQKCEKCFNVTTCLLLSLSFRVFCSFKFPTGGVLCMGSFSL